MKKNLTNFFEGKSFNADEAGKIAVALERHGFRFYNDMKDRVRNEKIRPVFAQMAAEEQKHIADIEALLDGPGSEWYLDPAAEEMVQRYFEDYLEGKLFPAGSDAESVVMKLENEIAAVRLALNFEKDAVAFYSDLARLADDEETKKAFSLLREVEEGHVLTLSGLLELLEG
ncbi:MAG: ferritin family protein [Deltaproteobacteria bacterium]|nr:ferritin family protein [Deltaproteobacteria bacterium]